MRDKVKRFLSILMTALMLVNLLPVGALAEGVMISNSVQSRGYQKPPANVYVYVKVTGDTTGLAINPSGWYTIGKSTNVPGMGTPYWFMHGSHSFSDVGVWPDTVLDKSRFTRHADNQKIDLDQITWTEFYVDNGADNYVKAGTYTWHMNGTIDIKQLPSVYTIKYVDYDTKELIHSYEKTGLMGQTPEKVTAPDSLQENLYSFYFVNGHPKEQTVDFKKDKGELTFYYKKNTAAYTVNYYLNGTKTKVAEPKKRTAALGKSVTESPITVDGYTPVSGDSKKITIKANSDENVINFYYYKNVELTANSDTVPYNGKEQSVSGFTGAPEDADFSAIEVGASGTDAGTYDANFPEHTVGKVDRTEKYIVTAATDGKLVIDPVETEVVVKIAGNTKTETYNGKEHSVEGYTVTSISNPLYTANDFTFSGTAEAKGTDAGTYPMGLTADQFTNNKSKNFSKVTFEVADGWLKIDPVETEVFVKIAGKTKTETYNGKEHSVEGYTVTSISNPLYTANDFTFSGTAEAKGTDAGTYPMGLTADQFTNNKSKNFSKVTFEVADGWLKIDPVETEVFVKIAGNTKTETYNGKEHNVEGYTVTSISNDLYTEDDFEFTGEAKATGTEAGTYYMGLTAADFTNNDSTNFSKVTFVVEDGWLKINPIDEVTVTITGKTKTETYNGNPYSVEGYTVTSISNDLYTEDDFEFTGEAKATGTEAGTYYMGLTAADFTNNDSTNFSKVTFVVEDGWLKINPIDEVTVTITENSGTATYDGGDHIVSGYASMTADNELYDVDASVQETPTAAWTVKGKDAGEYPVGIKADDFKNTNGNFTNVKFVVVDGKLTITPAPITLQASSRSKTYDGTPLEADGYGFYEGNPDLAKDIASVILTGSQTLVGSSESQITEVVLEKEKNPDNYKFTFLPGLLTVTDGTGDDPVKPENVVTKTHIPKDTGYNVGETVTFTVSVKNIYNVPKTITLTEKANVKFSNGESVIVFKDVPAGKTVKTEATYTITSADILAGVFHNTVTADFTGGGSWTAEDTVTTAELDTTLNVTKTSDVPEGQKAALGQTITYTIKVQNAGNVPYTNVKVEDPLTGLTETIETLPVGETQTFTTEYVVTEADVLKGSVLNTATATGDKIKDPKSDEPKEPNGGDEVETPTFAPITIKPKDVTATYNGAAITGKDVEITSGKLLEGHKLSAAVIGSGVNAGSYALTLDPEKIKIVDANNKDVSEMYARTLLPGKLIINKRSVLITSQSATKTYDGSALTRPAVTITGDGFVPGELAKAEATGSITKVGSTPNTIQYTTTGAFNAANYSIALSVGTLTVTEKPKPEPRRTFNLTINYVYQNGKRAAASYNRGGLKNGETFDITSPVIAGYTASETGVSGTIYNRDIKVTVIYTADGVNLDDYGVPLGLGNITMNVGDCFE